MSQENVKLVPLATMTLRLRAPVVFEDAAVGTRWLVEAEAGRIEGDRLAADIDGHANADWFVIGPSGVGTVDARLRAMTDDGAPLLLFYGGRTDVGAGAAQIYIAPRFEASDDRYRWLNLIQAVGRGSFQDRETLVYELFEVR